MVIKFEGSKEEFELIFGTRSPQQASVRDLHFVMPSQSDSKADVELVSYSDKQHLQATITSNGAIESTTVGNAEGKPETTEEAKTRKRRTKAEIEADKAKQVADPFGTNTIDTDEAVNLNAESEEKGVEIGGQDLTQTTAVENTPQSDPFGASPNTTPVVETPAQADPFSTPVAATETKTTTLGTTSPDDFIKTLRQMSMELITKSKEAKAAFDEALKEFGVQNVAGLKPEDRMAFAARLQSLNSVY